MALWWAGRRFFLLPKGRDLPVKRRAVLSDQIRRHGGELMEDLDGLTPESPAIIVVADDLKSQARRVVRAAIDNDSHLYPYTAIVTTEYISQCLRAKRDLGLDKFELPSLETPSDPEPINLTPEEESEEKEVESNDSSESADEAPVSDGAMTVSHVQSDSPSGTPAAVESQGVAPVTFSGTRRDAKGKIKVQVHKDESLNRALERELRDFSDLYGQLKNQPWRQRAYRMAADMIRRLPWEITGVRDLDRPELRRLGPHIREKVVEWLTTGRIQKKKNLDEDERLGVLRLFGSIWGIAHAGAEKLYSLGYRSIEDLRKDPTPLTGVQRIGLKHFEDFCERMDRTEAEAIIDTVQKAIDHCFPGNNTSLVPAGSYRRGALECGDCDMLWFKDEPLGQTLSILVGHLRREGFLIDDLLLPRQDEHGESLTQSYYGVCRLPGEGHRARRIDIKLYGKSVEAFAVLHFTGCGYFNRAMRYRAGRMGYSLGDKGMHRVVRSREGKVVAGPPIECKTEEDIFKILHLRYVPPTERLTGDISSLELIPLRKLIRSNITSSGSSVNSKKKPRHK